MCNGYVYKIQSQILALTSLYRDLEVHNFCMYVLTDRLESPRKTVCWSVFFNDLEQEVFPVTQGQRMTLTIIQVTSCTLKI